MENVAPILEIGYYYRYAMHMYNFKYKIVFHVVVAVGTSFSVGRLGTLTMVTDHSPLFVFKSTRFRPVSILIFVLCIGLRPNVYISINIICIKHRIVTSIYIFVLCKCNLLSVYQFPQFSSSL